MRLILKLINGIAKVLQKLFQHFFVRSSFVKPVVFCLNLNKALLTGKLSRVAALLKVG